MILEGIISSNDAGSGAHVTPMGYRMVGREVVVAPFVPSLTLENLRREGRAVLNLTDDVLIIAGCLTGRREWPLVRLESWGVWRLRDTLTHRVLKVNRIEDDRARPSFFCEVVEEVTHGPFAGFNRAQGAVIEAAILVSRLDWLSAERVARDMGYLQAAVDKTAGPRELQAWDWLTTAIAAHPRHQRPPRGAT